MVNIAIIVHIDAVEFGEAIVDIVVITSAEKLVTLYFDPSFWMTTLKHS